MHELKRLPEKLLVLCVDRDDDIEQVTGIQTPIIGRSDVLNVAVKFAVVKPEDSDANALFAAVKMYDQMREAIGENKCEVAVVAGLPGEGVEADMKILSELDLVLNRVKPDGVILVSDGPTDEQVLPIVSSRIPVISVRRVVVQQSRSMEETFVLFTGYAKKLIEDEKYRKYSLGIPGLFMLLYTILDTLNLVQYIGLTLMGVLGLILVFKGFALDEKLNKLRTYSPISIVSVAAAFIIFLVGLVFGIQNILLLKSQNIGEYVGFLLLTDIGQALNVADMMIIALLFLIGGRIANKIVNGKGLEWKDLSIFAFLIPFRQVLVEAAEMMLGKGDVTYLIYWAFASVMISILVATALVVKERFEHV